MNKAIIVDDDPIFAKALALKLEKEYNFEVTIFANAEKSFNGIQESPDIIFLDYHLSTSSKNMDGLMALGMYKKSFPNCKIIMMSSEENTHWLKQGEKYGSHGYMTKTPEALIDLVQVVKDFRKGQN